MMTWNKRLCDGTKLAVVSNWAASLLDAAFMWSLTEASVTQSGSYSEIGWTGDCFNVSDLDIISGQCQKGGCENWLHLMLTHLFRNSRDCCLVWHRTVQCIWWKKGARWQENNRKTRVVVYMYICTYTYIHKFWKESVEYFSSSCHTYRSVAPFTNMV